MYPPVHRSLYSWYHLKLIWRCQSQSVLAHLSQEGNWRALDQHAVFVPRGLCSLPPVFAAERQGKRQELVQGKNKKETIIHFDKDAPKTFYIERKSVKY